MKITAYKADCCGTVHEDGELLSGIVCLPELDGTYTFKSVKCDNAQKHFCMECYHKRVTVPANLAEPKRINRELYDKKIKELSYIFNSSLFGLLKNK